MPRAVERQSYDGRGLYVLETEFRRQVLLHYLAACHGNRSDAAGRLGLARTHFQELMRRHGVH